MRIAVVGAGASGLPAIKWALDEGFQVACFEKSDDIGGLWRFKPEPCPGEGTVMKSTVINTSKEMTAYSDFPPPADAANFMHNTELLEYFRSYAQHFNLLKHILLNHEVLDVKRAENFAESGQWLVAYRDSTNNSAEECFDAVLLCTGHHTEPHWPTPFPGQEAFQGKLMHSHDYKDHQGFEDKKVVVVGIGNSGADIAVELGKISKKVYLATRSGSWVMNRVWDFGEPTDLAFLNRVMYLLRCFFPWKALNFMLQRKINSRFDHGRFGLRPAHRVLEAHVTINDELPNRIISGRTVIKPNIASFSERGVLFDDGSVVDDVNVVIFATGFSFGFPLLESGNLIPVKENQVRLYLNMFSPCLAEKNTLAVIGLIQPTGSIMPISEMQCRLFMASLAGRIRLPPALGMQRDIDEDQKRMAEEFVSSRRHTIQVDYVVYMEKLAALLGVAPVLWRRWLADPRLAYALFTKGLVPYQYRLDGDHPWPGARDAILGLEERVFNATRTRRTRETMRARPGVNYVWRVIMG